MNESGLANAPLGHDIRYPDHYDPALLFPIAREANRAALAPLPPWTGADIWTAYELSWLNPRGKPMVGTARFVFPESSPCLIESKSLKLYLNSFTETRFDGTEAVRHLVEQDLSHAAGAPVRVWLDRLNANRSEVPQPLSGTNIDDLDVEIQHYQPVPGLLRCLPDAAVVDETLVSDLLKSNCPVTGQPDWGSVQVRYRGRRIDPASLLQYIVSLRRHKEFHEHCVEQMYCDIWRACQPEWLLVYARYTRRGGLDINPWRASSAIDVSLSRTPRQ
ncbi:MAG TPA: NADPH-dependent 7-cyano-7-deazaguanine reductase QueF [Burkholderiaceae bacterium]|nr:NADPH-dependent 7-cyano-7-deazaguanine reductase QueF [Burkholderiaceae bacterium]